VKPDSLGDNKKVIETYGKVNESQSEIKCFVTHTPFPTPRVNPA